MEVKRVRVHLPEHGDVTIPYWEVDSGRPGPRWLVVAAQHGCEVQGSEAVRRLVTMAATDLLRGSLVAVPHANPVSLGMRRHNINSAPEKPNGSDWSHNMNCQWPGNPEGNDTQRLVHALCAAVGERATHCLDMHCWARFLGAGVLPHVTLPDSCKLANLSGLPLAFPWELPDMTANPRPERFNLDTWFAVTGRGSLTFELAGQYLVDERQVQLGLRCALNMGRVIGLLPGEPEGTSEGPTWVDRSQVVKVPAPHSGLFVEAGAAPGGWVQAGEHLGHLLNNADLSVTQISAPVGGRLVTYGCHRANCDVSLPDQHPYADAGDELASIMPATPPA